MIWLSLEHESDVCVDKLWRLALFGCVLCCCQLSSVLACRYNVRETGFVDLGLESYYFYGYIKDDTPSDVVTSFEQILSEAFTDTNIRAEIVNIKEQKDNPAIRYLESLQIDSFPAAVLVSPDGQAIIVPVAEPNRPFVDTLRGAIGDILSSPKRKEILERAIKNYAVILLIEGKEPQENEMAKNASYAAIKSIEAQMEVLPKPIERPPVLVVADRKSLADEKILLWSLGLDVSALSGPYIAVIYGRVRWIGPLFKGEQIAEEYLDRVLFVVGEDCECGLDHRWVQGTMLPVKWDSGLQAKVAENLGFDPESPMIKMEIASMVSRGIGGTSYPGVPFGYKESVLEQQSGRDWQNGAEKIESNAATGSPAGESVVGDSVGGDICSPLRAMAMVAVGMAALVIIVGIVVLLRPKRI